MTNAPILLDFETVSRADLKKVGGRIYWDHPSTRPLCCAWYDTASGDVGVWQRGEVWPHKGRALAAHNWRGFDAFGAIREGWCTAEEARGHIDTSELARRAGLPGALDALGTRWCGFPKDAEASKFTKSLSSVRRPAGKGPGAISADVWRDLSDEEKRERGTQPAITSEAMQRVIKYCLSDVEIMAHGWPLLESWRELEPDVERVDRIVNDRGVHFDGELARALLECDARNSERVCADVAAELWATSEEVRRAAMSNAQFTALTGAANAQKATVAELDHPLARARRALASIARGKLEAGLARTSADGRMRDSLRYYGASTGRWAGRGMQLQNMPKPAKRFEKFFDDNKFTEAQIDEWICALADRVRSGQHVADQEEIDLLVRATICADAGKGFAVCDFSGVEARANAWYAGDTQAVDVFLSGRDAYKVAASAVFGVPYEQVTKAQRQLGKVLELACLAGDTRVITDHGVKALVDVTTDDRVWDGVEWVTHEGLVDRGERETVERFGMRATPDHEVLLDCSDRVELWGRFDMVGSIEVQKSAALFTGKRLAAYHPQTPAEVEAGSFVERVYDLVNAGPRHRFAVMTDAGPLIVHNCGYGQGGKKFAETAAKMGADLQAVGINSFAAVKAWRRLHAPIVQFWQDVEDAFVRAIHGEVTRVSDFTFTPSDDGRDVAIFLPSGRPIVYCDVTIRKREIYNDDGEVTRVTNSICMPGMKGPEWLYGGLLVENVIQAACRDLMADALVRAEDAGLSPVLHVHDEIVCEVDRAAMHDAFDELRVIMTTWPEWATGFPGGAAGFAGLRYRK